MQLMKEGMSGKPINWILEKLVKNDIKNQSFC